MYKIQGFKYFAMLGVMVMIIYWFAYDLFNAISTKKTCNIVYVYNYYKLILSRRITHYYVKFEHDNKYK